MPGSEKRSEASRQDQDDDQLSPYASTVFSASGVELADCVADLIDEYNTVRPHQTLEHRQPLDAYLDDRTLKPTPPRNEQNS